MPSARTGFQVPRPVPELSDSCTEVVADEECWLFAYIQDTLLHVYRSIQLPEDDPDYLPVRDLIRRGAELVKQVTVRDDNMMMGRAYWSIFRMIGRCGANDL